MVPGRCLRRGVLAAVAFLAALVAGASSAQLGTCGPFTDVPDDAFCPFVLEIFYIGITTGVTPTTYDPTGNVTRLQMAAFLSRTVDTTLKRGSRRALLRKFYTPQSLSAMGVTTFGTAEPVEVACDGRDVWVTGINDGSVWRIRGSDGRLLGTWTAATPQGVVSFNGQVAVTGYSTPGRLYRIDPTLAPGAATTVASNLGDRPDDLAFDGSRFWTTNEDGSVSIVTPQAAIPWTVTTVTTGLNNLYGLLFDGSNIWVRGGGLLIRLDSSGAVLQTVTVGLGEGFPVFDGTNIWAPDFKLGSNSVSVVRASSGAVLATLTGNGIDGANAAAFDGERVLVTNGLGASVSLWKASDFTPLGSFPTGNSPAGACSDGLQFWIATQNGKRLLRF